MWHISRLWAQKHVPTWGLGLELMKAELGIVIILLIPKKSEDCGCD